MDIPQFKFHEDPIRTGVIKKEKTKCPVCNEDREYVYVGPFHSNERIKGICPWCIADGKAAQKYKAEFQDSASLEEPVEKSELLELVERNPGYIAWQQEQWLVHCGSPCTFVDYFGWKEIQEKGIDVEEDIRKQAESYGLDIEEFKQELHKDSGISGYLFRCIRCGKYRLTTDCD